MSPCLGGLNAGLASMEEQILDWIRLSLYVLCNGTDMAMRFAVAVSMNETGWFIDLLCVPWVHT